VTIAPGADDRNIFSSGSAGYKEFQNVILFDYLKTGHSKISYRFFGHLGKFDSDGYQNTYFLSFSPFG